MSESETSSYCSWADSIFQVTAKVFTRQPVLVLFLTLVLGVTLSWLGLVQNGIPEFDDPYLVRRYDLIALILFSKRTNSSVSSLSLIRSSVGAPANPIQITTFKIAYMQSKLVATGLWIGCIHA
jgi:hypothetical protein